MSFRESADDMRVRLENTLTRARLEYAIASNSLALARRKGQSVRWWEKRVKAHLDDVWKAQNNLGACSPSPADCRTAAGDAT